MLEAAAAVIKKERSVNLGRNAALYLSAAVSRVALIK